MRLSLLFLLLVSSAHAYKFLCNGIDAQGQVESDSCGVCNDQTGSRWSGGTVSFNVNTRVLPPGISGLDWKNLVTDCFNTWEATPNSNLSSKYIGEGVRSFGVDENNHDILWMTDSSEWMENVGAGPSGILGVTLPLYECPGNGVNYRAIHDADMILNGLAEAGFPWELGCLLLSDSCQSIRGTVQHESGHFLGLGHPCVSCESVMSAQAAYLVEDPLFDDQSGLRALYPGNSPGVFGADCSNAACSAGLDCYTKNQNHYCTHDCKLDSDCENQLTCNSGVCEFPSGQSLGAVGLHEDCTSNPCEEGLKCVTVQDRQAYCYTDCTSSQSCQISESCHQLKDSNKNLINSYACMVMLAENQVCGGTTVCQSGLTCLAGVCQKGLVENPSVTPPNSHCASAGIPTELWVLLLLMSIAVHRVRRRC